MDFRWLTSNEIEHFVNPTCQQQGWPLLNISDERPTCRVLGKFDGPRMIGFIALQLHPVLGPAYVAPDYRDGQASRELADKMHEFIVESECRGVLMVADEPTTERIALRHGMEKVDAPVYLWVGE